MIVVSDTTPLISLLKIDRLDLLEKIIWRNLDSTSCIQRVDRG